MRHRPGNLFDRSARRWAEGPLSPVLLAGLALAILTFNSVPRASAASCVPAPAGLVGWWSGDGNANDIAGTNNGTFQGGATASAVGEVGQAFSFDGTNTFVQIPDSPALRPTNLTVEAWMRFSALDSAGNSMVGQQYIIFKQNTRSGSFEGYYLGKERAGSADTFHFAVSSSAGQSVDLASATLVQTGVWYHVAAVRGSDFIQLYVNGQLERQASVSFPQDYGDFPLYFGSSGQWYWDAKFAGSLDEVSLYNRALSSNEIAAIYLAGVAGKCKGNQFTFTTNNGTLTITGYTGLGGDVTIPGRIDDLLVTGVGSSAFSSRYSLTSVTMPNSVTSIGADAFSDCVRLANVTIPSSVTRIGAGAFIGCRSLSAITVDANNPAYSSVDGVLFDKNQATLMQYPASKAGGDYSIPSSVASIGDYAFYYCTSLTNVTIPNSVTSIGEAAFQYCTGLTGVTIGSSVIRIGMSAFQACSRLSAITVDANNPAYSSVGGVLFDKSQTTLMQYPQGKAGSNYSIPSSVTGIGDYAFYNCISLTNVTISDGVRDIGNYAFWFCTSLTGVTIGSSVTRIGGCAFWYCTSLTSVTIPNRVTRIEGQAFASCTSLSGITIGNSVTNIENYAFQGCKGLTSVTIPSSVTSIGHRAFEHCTGLTSVTIPNNVTSIGSEAFHWCTGLTNVTIGTNVASLGDDAFAYCTNLTSVTIPNSVTNIGAEAFWWCFGLTSVTIPNSVTSIARCTFYCCISLTNVTIPNSVTNIGYRAFEGCQRLASMTIPSSVTSIGDQAFISCTNLTGVYFQGNAPSLGSAVFAGDNNVTVYYLPGATGWTPQVQTSGANFGVRNNRFGFTITGASDLVVVVQACTDLAAPVWSPAETNILAGGSFYFSDPAWTNYVRRFYRLWSPAFGGRPTALWNPRVHSLGVRASRVGFMITGTTNIPIVVEACTNLTSASWTALQTCILTNGSIYFSDAAWTNYPARFYRIRSP